jgi:putative ABC transport system ATP-binding protein
MEGHDTSKENNRTKEVLEVVRLDGYEKKKVYQCSGGEQQRVAIEKLMLKPCELILADEPTGSWDHKRK